MRTPLLPPATDVRDGPTPPAHELADVLARAVSDGIIQPAQADAILSLGTSSATAPAEEGPGTRVRALVAEALGYVGAALALVSAILVVQQFWADLRPWSRVALLGLVAASLTAAGMFVRDDTSPALARLGSFLWLLASAAVAAFSALTAAELFGLEEAEIVLAAGAVTAAFSATLWTVRRRPLQQLATFASLPVTGVAGLSVVGVDLAGNGALLVWALGVAWVLLAYAGRLLPTTTAYVLGAVAALLGPFLGAGDEARWTLLLGLATAGLLIAASIPLRRTLLLGLGTAGLFLYVPRIVFTWFGEALGPAVALFVTGMVLITVSLALTRLRPQMAAPRHSPDHPPEVRP